MLYARKDINRIKYFFKDTENAQNSERLLSAMISFSESTTCRRRNLLSYFGEQSNFTHNKSCCDVCSKPVMQKAILRKAPSQKKIILDKSSSAIFESLKAWRKKIAEEENVPPYIIFGDKTLLDVAQKKPSSKRELLECYGIGNQKAERFGFSLLRIVRSD